MIGIQKSIKGKDVVVLTSNSCKGLLNEYIKYINSNYSCYGGLVFSESPVCRFVSVKGGYALVFTWYNSDCNWCKGVKLPRYELSTLGLARRTLRGVDVEEFKHDFGTVFGIVLSGMSEDELLDTFSKTLKQSSDFIANLPMYEEQYCSWYLNMLPLKNRNSQVFCIYPECLGQYGVYDDYVNVLGKVVRLV